MVYLQHKEKVFTCVVVFVLLLSYLHHEVKETVSCMLFMGGFPASIELITSSELIKYQSINVKLEIFDLRISGNSHVYTYVFVKHSNP